MVVSTRSIASDTLSVLLLISVVSICITTASTSSFSLDETNDRLRRADEYVMTSAYVRGIRRSNICGDGYRIEGALLKSYPYSKTDFYLPYEDCYITFKARRPDNQIRVRILLLDLNDIHGGVNCLDSLRFYKSAYINRKDKLNTVECGQLKEEQRIHVDSPTGMVTAHFSTDGGNVNGQGFKVVLTAFRFPNKTHPCDSDNEEFLCNTRECISNVLLCDGVPHCLDGSDELPYRSCSSSIAEPLNSGSAQANSPPTISKRQNWRGIVIAAFLLIIFIVFILFTMSFLYRRCVRSSVPLHHGERKNYATILHSSKNGPSITTAPTTQVIISNERTGKRLDDDYNLL